MATTKVAVDADRHAISDAAASLIDRGLVRRIATTSAYVTLPIIEQENA